MEIRDRGIIKNKIALALYNTFLSSMFMGNNGTCKPKDFKKYVKGHLATEGELTEDIMIFFDLFAPNGVDGANELIFYINKNKVDRKQLALNNKYGCISKILEVNPVTNDTWTREEMEDLIFTIENHVKG